jgi:alpha-mannosidase
MVSDKLISLVATVPAVHDNRRLIEERIDRELLERVLPLVHPRKLAMTVEAGPSLDALRTLPVPSPWGPPWGTTWFRCRGEVPAEWSSRRVEAIIDLGFAADSPGFQCEGLVRGPRGEPIQGLHPRRTAVPVAAGAGPVELVIEAASNPTFPPFRPSPLGSPTTAGESPLYEFTRADLVVVDEDAEALFHDFCVLDGVMRTMLVTDRRRAQLLTVLARSLDALTGGATPAEARAVLAPALAAPTSSSAHRAIATGHAHIDTAWLWPMRETVRKCVRTFASVVALMDDEPDFVFSCSQAQQYEWVRQHEPELFERIRAKVAAGQWVPVGGMWVEADMNLPSGESIARQIVHGQRWFAEHFGLTCSEVWIPDVFGYPGSLPQIFAAGGMRRFVTQKLSWNKTNRFPHQTFWWEGIDGSRVLTHFPPVDTYGAEVTPAELSGSMERFAEHAWSNVSLIPYGYGDGGGGPTREMLARAARLADLDPMPHVELGSAARFFELVEAEAAAGAPVPVWRGELYFETHRGTLTSQLKTKLGNRRCERLLRDAELWAATAALGGADVDPHELDECWQEVLTQQFHDILPGSSIAWVHAEAEEVFDRVAADLERRIATRLATLAPGGGVVANAATLARAEVVTAAAAPPGDGPTQQLPDGRVAAFVRAPGLGIAPLTATAVPVGPGGGTPHVVVTDRSMSNGKLAISWALEGALTSVIDVARGRELIPGGVVGAELLLAPDRPVQYDAWDLESWTIDASAPLGPADSIDVEAAGPLVGIVVVRRSFGPSSAVVRYVLRAGSPRLDVEVELDWHHDEHLLSMRFPLDVHAETASCGIQFGAVRRPTHPSTTWDAAKFEVCAHRFVDVAEPDFGVAVLNNGRYGHGLFGPGLGGAQGSQVRVSLARAAKYPDPDADHGHHAVTLALLPHGAGLADVVAEAERLELPLRVVDAAEGTDPGRVLPAPVVTVTGRGVEVDAVKVADDGSGDLVVRLHEATGNRVAATVAASTRIAAAAACDLLEQPQRHYEVSDGICAVTLRPFQLMTLRLTAHLL